MGLGREVPQEPLNHQISVTTAVTVVNVEKLNAFVDIIQMMTIT